MINIGQDAMDPLKLKLCYTAKDLHLRYHYGIESAVNNQQLILTSNYARDANKGIDITMINGEMSFGHPTEIITEVLINEKHLRLTQNNMEKSRTITKMLN